MGVQGSDSAALPPEALTESMKPRRRHPHTPSPGPCQVLPTSLGRGRPSWRPSYCRPSLYRLPCQQYRMWSARLRCPSPGGWARAGAAGAGGGARAVHPQSRPCHAWRGRVPCRCPSRQVRRPQGRPGVGGQSQWGSGCHASGLRAVPQFCDARALARTRSVRHRTHGSGLAWAAAAHACTRGPCRAVHSDSTVECSTVWSCPCTCT